MNLIVRLKDNSAIYRHENSLGVEEVITLDSENGILTLTVKEDDGGGMTTARYRLDAVEYWTTGHEVYAPKHEGN